MDEYWSVAARLERAYYRAHNVTGRVTLKLGDDTNPIQLHQLEGYDTELRDGMHRFQTFGFASMPLPGTKGMALYQSGHRNAATVVGDEHPSYRPKNQKPGEFLVYAVSGAGADGTGGTMRPILKGTVDGNGVLTGLEIDIGDTNTTDVKIKASHKVTITAPEVDISNGGTLQAVKLADGSNSTVLKAQ